MKKKWIIGLGSFLLALPAHAQEVAQEAAFDFNFNETEVLLMIITLLAVLTLVVLISIIITANVLRKVIDDPEGYRHAQQHNASRDLWKRISQKLTRAVPVTQEERVMTSHNYDGIRELDNDLPPWWKYLFYLTVVFAIVYLWVFEVTDNGPTQAEEYAMEMVEAREAIEAYRMAQVNSIDESNVTLLTAASELEVGAKLYAANCQACHAADLGGGVGPNLTDDYWLHGGSISDVFRTLKYGVTEKGMISWQDKMSPLQMQQLSSYVLSMVGTSPANPKEQQGELYVPEEQPADEETEAPIDVTLR